MALGDGRHGDVTWGTGHFEDRKGLARSRGLSIGGRQRCDNRRDCGKRPGWHYNRIQAPRHSPVRLRSKEKDPDIITTKPGPWKRLEIAYDDIDTLVIAENRPTLKRWQKARQAIEKVVVMSRGDLDVSRLATGWYAHVVYTSEGIEGAATGEIIDKDADRIVIEYRPRASRYGRAKWKRLEIAFDDIDAIAVAQDRGDVEVWRKVRQAVQTRRETTKAPSCEIGANLLSSISVKGHRTNSRGGYT